MKLIKGNGITLEVRDVSEPLYVLTSRSVPIKEYGSRIVSDDEARELIKKYRSEGHAGQAFKKDQDSASA